MVAEKDQDVVPPQAPKVQQLSEKSNHQEEEKLEEQKSEEENAPDLDMPMAELVKKFNLIQSYDTLEGHSKLKKEQLQELWMYSSKLAKDQGGCRLI